MNCSQGANNSFTIYIDGSYSGSISDGSYTTPFSTINQALSATTLSGSSEKVFHVNPGIYVETLNLSSASNLIIEGGTSKFTLSLTSSPGISLTSSSVQFINFDVNASTLTSAAITSSDSKINMNNISFTLGNALIDQSGSSFTASNLTVNSSSMSASIFNFNATTGFHLHDSKVSGGAYSIKIMTGLGVDIQNNIFTSIRDGAIFLNKNQTPTLKNLNITMPNNASSTSAVYLSNGNSGVVEDIKITGSGSSAAACSGGLNENGISLVKHGNLVIERPNISNIGCAAVSVDTSENVVIARFSLSNSGYGALFKTSSADLFKGDINNSQLTGVHLVNSITAIDFSNITSSLSHGIRIANTTATNTNYGFANSNTVSNNGGDGVHITGSNIAPGYGIVIKTTTFQNNTGFAIQSDTPANLSAFFCENLTMTIQPLTLSASLSTSSCNL